MSIASEISRLTNLRNTIRTKLVALGLAAASDDLDDCATAISGISAQAAQTITPTGTAQTIAAGKYLVGAQTVEAVVCDNLTAANIVSGVTVKVGTASDDDSVASVTGTASGGGGYYTEGTYTVAEATRSFSVSVNFQPKYVYAFATNWRELTHTSWQTGFVAGAMSGEYQRARCLTRLNNGTPGTNGNIINDAIATYSNGTLTFDTANASYKFPTGATFAWFAAGNGSSS